MLDDMNVLKQRDSEATLDSGTMQPEQLSMEIEIKNADHDRRDIKNIVFVGMGGSALAPEFFMSWRGADFTFPFEVVKGYELPAYTGANTLVFVSSCSGNTEEALTALESARSLGAEIAIITGGGTLAEKANQYSITHVVLPPIKIQPRMLTFVQVRALMSLLATFEVLDAQPLLEEMADAEAWLQTESRRWHKDSPVDQNEAKQFALTAVGKIAEFIGGHFTASIAYKWKISWNENAKNLAYWNQYPEFNHNEFIGWSSHPIEKPFVIFDIFSPFENDRIQKRFELTDRLLSGQRPKAIRIQPDGDSKLKQLLWAHLLADFTSIYLGIINNVDPGPVPLVTKLKQELSQE